MLALNRLLDRVLVDKTGDNHARVIYALVVSGSFFLSNQHAFFTAAEPGYRSMREKVNFQRAAIILRELPRTHLRIPRNHLQIVADFDVCFTVPPNDLCRAGDSVRLWEMHNVHQ